MVDPASSLADTEPASEIAFAGPLAVERQSTFAVVAAVDKMPVVAAADMNFVEPAAAEAAAAAAEE